MPMNPSIFNDVIGPVMRGPSSSHCAAALRLGWLARDLLEGDIEHVLIQLDRNGSLASTHESQGSDMGLFAGLLGWQATDERLPEAARTIRASGVQVEIEIGDLGFDHPNTYRIDLCNARCRHVLTGISTGGGMIEVVALDGAPISILGDFWETLVWMAGRRPEAADRLAEKIDADEVLVHECTDGVLLQVKAQRAFDDGEIGRLCAGGEVRHVRRLRPVLPVLSRRRMSVPFSTYAAMLRYDRGRNLPPWELAVQYESERGSLSPDEVLQRMVQIVRIVRASLQQGLRGTTYRDRILGPQCGQFQARLQAGGLLEAGLLNPIIRNVTALMEVKSAMGVIVAAPTAALVRRCRGLASPLPMPWL